MVERKINRELYNKLVGWAKNSSHPAKKLARYFGVSEELMQRIIDEERPEWLPR